MVIANKRQYSCNYSVPAIHNITPVIINFTIIYFCKTNLLIQRFFCAFLSGYFRNIYPGRNGLSDAIHNQRLIIFSLYNVRYAFSISV